MAPVPPPNSTPICLLSLSERQRYSVKGSFALQAAKKLSPVDSGVEKSGRKAIAQAAGGMVEHADSAKTKENAIQVGLEKRIRVRRCMERILALSKCGRNTQVNER